MYLSYKCLGDSTDSHTSLQECIWIPAPFDRILLFELAQHESHDTLKFGGQACLFKHGNYTFSGKCLQWIYLPECLIWIQERCENNE